MMLCDESINELQGLSTESDGVIIDPYNPEQVQPSSYDVLLGDGGVFRKVDRRRIVDPFEDDPSLADILYQKVSPNVGSQDKYTIEPGKLYLACTHEVVYVHGAYAVSLTGKSTWGRLGLLVHATAGHVDSGFRGNITLELFNISSDDLVITVGKPIAQILIHKLDGTPGTEYDGKYTNSSAVGTVLPKFWSGR